jgi:hypothetical protein
MPQDGRNVRAIQGSTIREADNRPGGWIAVQPVGPYKWSMSAILTGILTAFDWVLRLVGLRREGRDRKEDRVRRVVDAFGSITRGGERDGVKAFLQAGAKELDSSNEVRSAVDRIVGRYGTNPHPLGKEGEQLKSRPDIREYVQALNPDEDHDPPDYNILYIG